MKLNYVMKRKLIHRFKIKQYKFIYFQGNVNNFRIIINKTTTDRKLFRSSYLDHQIGVTAMKKHKIHAISESWTISYITLKTSFDSRGNTASLSFVTICDVSVLIREGQSTFQYLEFIISWTIKPTFGHVWKTMLWSFEKTGFKINNLEEKVK